MVNYTTTNKSKIRTTALQFMYLTNIYMYMYTTMQNCDNVKLKSRHNETNTALSGAYVKLFAITAIKKYLKQILG